MVRACKWLKMVLMHFPVLHFGNNTLTFVSCILYRSTTQGQWFSNPQQSLLPAVSDAFSGVPHRKLLLCLNTVTALKVPLLWFNKLKIR